MAAQQKHIDILDTTLRDGSYTIGYQFTAEETSLIAQGLELAGVGYIEIGHGLGLGADQAGKGSQAVTDLRYMRACAAAIRSAKFGFFFIPGIGAVSDLKLLAEEGGKFVRIGVTLDQDSVDQACRIIEEACRLGLEVWVNIMKTYAYSAQECQRQSLKFVQAGANGVYVVDSAGGMLPSEVSEYVLALKSALGDAGVNARIGFHGHDNLSLGAGCSLAAVDAGCDIVDGSLLGIGRSMGNAATEVLAMVLDRAGYQTGVNAWHAADLAENTIRPFLEQRWRHNSLDQALGYAQIHSGFLPVLERAASKRSVSIREIVLALGPDARKHISEADAMAAAERAIGTASGTMLHPADIETPDDGIAEGHADISRPDPSGYAAEIKSQSLRMAKPAAIVVTGPWRAEGPDKVRLQQIRLLAHAVVGAIEISNASDLGRVVEEIDGAVDILFLDKTPRSPGWNEAITKLESRKWRSRMLPYADEIAGMIGACHIVAIEAGKRRIKDIAVAGSDTRAETVRALLPYWGVRVVEQELAQILVIAGNFDGGATGFHSGVTLVFDLMSGFINADIARRLLEGGAEVIRLDGRVALVGEVIGLLEAQNLADQVMGRGSLDGFPIVAGGAWGREGEVVVDSVAQPTRVIGIADGAGGIKSRLDTSEVHMLKKIGKAIRSSLLAKVLRPGPGAGK